MRHYLALGLGLLGSLLILGCAVNSRAAQPQSKPLTNSSEKCLYTDEPIAKLIKGQAMEKDRLVLDVVAAGQTRPLEDVLKDLGIDQRRLQVKRRYEAGKCAITYWQISPSYDLSYVAATNGRSRFPLDHPNEKSTGSGLRKERHRLQHYL